MIWYIAPPSLSRRVLLLRHNGISCQINFMVQLVQFYISTHSQVYRYIGTYGISIDRNIDVIGLIQYRFSQNLIKLQRVTTYIKSRLRYRDDKPLKFLFSCMVEFKS